MKRASLHTLGCKVNFAEISTMSRALEAAGWEVVDSGVVDLIVVNSCSVTAAADKKCRNLISRLHRGNPDARIVVTGCYATRAPREVAALAGVTRVIGNLEKEKTIINSEITLCRQKCADFAPIEASEGEDSTRRTASTEERGGVKDARFSRQTFFPAYSLGDRTRSFLKVQDGCDYRCSYCTIHAARGSSRNPSIASLVDQAREIAAAGVREIVLTGVNTGDFGRSTGERFVDLLRALDAEFSSPPRPPLGGGERLATQVDRFRISSIEPNLLTDGVIDLCAASERFMPHFHIPLQSGCDRILGLMRRRYTTEKFAERVAKVREKMPDTFFGIDVIVGFPSETDDDFEATYNFLTALRPAELHVFPYSVRPDTPAAAMEGRVAPKIIAERAARLGCLSERLHGEFTEKFRGRKARVLWEGAHKGGKMSGFTENYIKIFAPFDPAKINTIEEIEL